MNDYEVLRLVWWLLLGVLLIGFAISDGFDLGLAALLCYLGRNEAERRAVLASIEPVWEGNQVWLLLGGGAVFAAWPLLYAASFSALYRAMLLLLLALILRPVGLGFRNLLADPRWRTSWDRTLATAAAVPALLFGVAFGNLFLGLPFHFDGLERPVYTGGFSNLLQPFALLAGATSASMLLMHGAVYATMKLGEPMATRARATVRVAAATFIACFIAAGLYLHFGISGHEIVSQINPAAASDPLHKEVALTPGGWLHNFTRWPALWAAPLTALLGAIAATALVRRERSGAAFIASSITQAATILTAAFALYPFLLPSSTQPNQGLTIWDASSSVATLRIMLWAAIVFVPIVLLYTTWVFRVMRGRVVVHALPIDSFSEE